MSLALQLWRGESGRDPRLHDLGARRVLHRRRVAGDDALADEERQARSRDPLAEALRELRSDLGAVDDRADVLTAVHHRSCRRAVDLAAIHEDVVRLVSVEGAPRDGERRQPSTCRRRGAPELRDDLTVRVDGEEELSGSFLELCVELSERAAQSLTHRTLDRSASP